MLRPSIDLTIWQTCHPCEARLACKTRALVKIDIDDPPYVAIERCSGCGACVLACACDAIYMTQSGSAVGAGCRGISL
jgi:Fe-S-cluster-containing hydrogenase component 2